MAYFQYFPQITYDVRGDKKTIRSEIITNVLVRVRKKIKVLNTAFFEQVFLNDGDRPDTIAHQFYDDSQLHWIVLYANYMSNPYYDWPMSYFDLQKFVDKKYPNNSNGIHHYEDEEGWVVDSDVAGSVPITNFVYEEKINDENRSINVIKPEFIPRIIQELKDLI